jgi:hypothetical protein
MHLLGGLHDDKVRGELVKHGAEAFPGMGRRSAGKDEVTRLRKELERVT